MVTKAVSDALSSAHGGIADQTIRFGGMPCLEKEDQVINKSGARISACTELTLAVHQVMRKSVVSFPAQGMRFDELGVWARKRSR